MIDNLNTNIQTRNDTGDESAVFKIVEVFHIQTVHIRVGIQDTDVTHARFCRETSAVDLDHIGDIAGRHARYRVRVDRRSQVRARIVPHAQHTDQDGVSTPVDDISGSGRRSVVLLTVQYSSVASFHGDHSVRLSTA